MRYVDEIVIAALLLLSICIYFFRHSESNRAEKLKAIAAYRRTQIISIKLQDILSQYILLNECYNEPFRDGKTFGQYLTYMQDNHLQNLPESNYLRLRNGNNRSFRKKMMKSVEEENRKLRELKEHLSAVKEAVTT